VTFLAQTDGNVKVIGKSSFIAGYASSERRAHNGLATNSLCKINALHQTRKLKFQRQPKGGN
jgi:hypothetical protein